MADGSDRIVAPTRLIMAATTTNPSEGSGLQVPNGSTVYEDDTGDMYITKNKGANWKIKGDVASAKIKTITGSSSCAGLGAYTANDVISASTAASGTMTAFAAVAREDGGSGYITNARLSLGTTLITPRITALIFNAGTLFGGTTGDNTPNTSVAGTDQATYIGPIDFGALGNIGTGGNSEFLATPSTVGNLPMGFVCASDADDLYALLVTRDDVTIGTNVTTRVDLTVEQL